MRLESKTAVIYGASGGIGAAVAQAFAREGARVFLTGRTPAKLEPVAKAIQAAGGRAEVAQVDALDEQAIDRHLDSVTAKTGGIDISFNAVGIPNTTLQGVPMVDLAVDQFSLPIATYTRTNFVTPIVARRGAPLVGGFAVAMAAIEGLTRGLSAELASQGVRVLGLRQDAIPETGTIKEVFGIHAKAYGITWEQFHDMIAGFTHRRRLTTLTEVANAAAFLVSDEASAMTGTIANLTLGALDD